jgi:hypothetical protein
VSVTGTASARDADPSKTSATVTLTFAGSRAACLIYLAASTRLLNSNGGALRALPDGVTRAGIAIGAVGVLHGDMRSVDFKVRAVAAPAGRRCG